MIVGVGSKTEIDLKTWVGFESGKPGIAKSSLLKISLLSTMAPLSYVVALLFYTIFLLKVKSSSKSLAIVKLYRRFFWQVTNLKIE